MGKYGSPSIGVFLVDGYNLLAAKVQTLSKKEESITERTEGAGDSFHEHTPTGMKKGMLAQGGAFFDDSTNNIHDALKSTTTVSRTGVVNFDGNTIGKHFTGFSGLFSVAYDVLAKVGGLTKANAAYLISGAIERGIIVQHLVAKTVDWNTKTLGTPVDYTTDPAQLVIPITSNTQANPTVITTPVPHRLTSGQKVLIAGNTGSNAAINGERVATVITDTTFSIPVNCTTAGGTGGTFVQADSPNGCAGYQQVKDFSGFTGFVGKLQHSTDDVTYVDVVIFANVTSAPNAQRVTAAGTIRRYLAYDGDVTGAGSINVFAGLARL